MLEPQWAYPRNVLVFGGNMGTTQVRDERSVPQLRPVDVDIVNLLVYSIDIVLENEKNP